MDFGYSDEQKLLADSVDRFVRQSYGFESWRKLVKSDEGYSPAHWRQMAELGWLGAALPEAHGGLGGGPVETMIIMEGIGKGLVLEPYFSTVVLGGTLVAQAGSEAQKSELLPRIGAGELKLAFAQAEHQARFDLVEVATMAARSGAGWRLDGRKIFVRDAISADRLIVLARTAGSARARKGLSLFLVDAGAKGLSRRDYRTVDNRHAADIAFEGVTVPAEALLGPVDGALPIVERAVDHAIAALAAEAVGAMQVLHEATLAYLRTRKQFGRPIGDFQVLQHRAVDMFVALEQARSMAIAATLKLKAPARERARFCAAAKVQIGQSGRFVGQQAVQLHGGMGMTDELNVGHYMKRLMAIDMAFGNADWHLNRFAAAA